MRVEPTPGRSSITLDFQALAATAATLRALHAEMADTQGSLTAQLDPDVQRALQSAEANWTGQRRKLAHFFADAADCLDHASSAYREVDESIASASRPGGDGHHHG